MKDSLQFNEDGTVVIVGLTTLIEFIIVCWILLTRLIINAVMLGSVPIGLPPPRASRTHLYSDGASVNAALS